MADSPLIDIFDLCVERLAMGDTVEDCLRDYPAYADELRSMLEMSLLVFQAQADSDDEQQAQAHTRTRIEEALQTDFAPRKGKNSMFTLRRSALWVGGAAAAIFAFAFGFAFATTPAQEYYPVAYLSTHVPVTNEFDLTATQYILEITQTAQSLRDNGASLEELGDPSALLTATQYALEVEATNIAIRLGAEASPPPLATMTVTATATVTVTATPPGTATPAPTGGDKTLGSAVVSTSVAEFLPMTATLIVPGEVPASSIEKDATDADSSPVLAEAGRDVGSGGSSDEFHTDDSSTDLLPFMPTSAAPMTAVAPYSTSVDTLSGGMLAPVAISQEQLDPMKAGEIDDNAEWDTYTEFRRNYLSAYGQYSIVDLDVTGRRIIKVIDALGNPILGAHVEVYMDQTRVSDSLTYATGLTLFFPNALESTQRRDMFQVLVSVDQYQTSQTLNLKEVGDVLTVQMPLVIVRDGLANEFLPATPPPTPAGPVMPFESPTAIMDWTVTPVIDNWTATPSPAWTPAPPTLIPVMRAT